MKKIILLMLLVSSYFAVAKDFDIESAFGLHKGMTKNKLDKVITDFKKQSEEPNFYCTTYNSNHVPIKGNFDYYTYTFYKDGELVGITGIKKNIDNNFLNSLLVKVRSKFGDETDSNKNYPLEDDYYYDWNLKKDMLNTVFIRFVKQKPIK